VSEDAFSVLTPLFALALGALVVLVLEAAGTPIGARKIGARVHLVFIALAAVVIAAIEVAARFTPATASGPLFVVDVATRVGALLVLVVLALALVVSSAELASGDGDRGEVTASMLFAVTGELVIVLANDLVMVFVGALLSMVAGFALVVVDRRDGRAIEAAVKHVVAGAFLLVVVGLGAATLALETASTSFDALRGAHGLASLLVVVFALEGMLAFPLHVARTDIVTGAPSFAGVILVGARAISATVLLTHVAGAGALEAAPFTEVLPLLVVVGLVVPPLVAVDQREIPRAAAHQQVAHMAVALAAVLLAGERASVLAPLAAFVAASSTLGAMALFHTIPPVRRGLSWELWSGAGRAHPFAAAALVIFLASSCALPLFPGLALRLEAASGASDLVSLVVVLASPLVLLCPLRLALFMFAKSREARTVEPRATGRVGIVVVIVLALLVSIALARPSVSAFLVGA